LINRAGRLQIKAAMVLVVGNTTAAFFVLRFNLKYLSAMKVCIGWLIMLIVDSPLSALIG
jgi:hypothetical protein